MLSRPLSRLHSLSSSSSRFHLALPLLLAPLAILYRPFSLPPTASFFSTSTALSMTVAPVKPAPPSSDAFLAAVESRRSRYSLAKSSPVADEKIIEIVQTAIKHGPSAFNTQSSRAVVLFGSKHEKFWNTAEERFKAAVSAEFFAQISPKLLQMKDAYGTVLLFEDSAAFEPLLAKMPFIAPNLPPWSENAHGIVSYIIWTALYAEGLGASLQHYTELVQEDVEEMFQVPSTWKLRANLVFGAPTVPPMEKTFQPLEDRVKVFA